MLSSLILRESPSLRASDRGKMGSADWDGIRDRGEGIRLTYIEYKRGHWKRLDGD